MSNFTAAAVGNENTHPHATADGVRTLCGMKVAETGADFDLLQIAGRCPYCHREAAARTETKPMDTPMDTVVAEDAPIGVQLWPTRTPAHAPNFTLVEVQIVRTETQRYVRWVYENGNERVFQVGQRVAVQLSQPEAPVEHLTKTLAYCAHCGSAIGREAGLWVDVVSGDQGGTYDHCPESSGGHQPKR